MSGAGKQPCKRFDENGSRKDKPSPEKEEAQKTLSDLATNQLVPQPRYKFPEQDKDKELVQSSAPAELQQHLFKQDLVRGEDGLMYPLVPYKSLRERIWQEDQKAKREALQRPPPQPRSSSESSDSPPPRESDSDDGLQFKMDPV